MSALYGTINKRINDTKFFFAEIKYKQTENNSNV